MTEIETSRRDYEDLLRIADAGAPIVNALLGFRIPRPTAPKPLRALPESGRGDNLFAWLQAAMLPLSSSELKEWNDFMSFNAAFAPGVEVIPMMEEEVFRLAQLDEAELLSCVAGSFDFSPARFVHPEAPGSHISIKIGHMWWELLAARCCLRGGRQLHRELSMPEWCDYGFDEMLSGILKNQFETRKGFVHDDVTLGLSFGSGDVTHDLDLERPLHPVIRGAVIGGLSYFRSLFPDKRPATIADGSAAKLLFWDGELDAFCEGVRRWSEIVVFIVSTSLERIALRGWTGEAHIIALPELRMYELWPATLAYCAGRLAPLIQSGKRVSIFMQCGVLTIPLGIMAHKMAQERRGASVKCYDFGQVLDIALYPHEPGLGIGPWSAKSDVIDKIREMSIVPFAMSEKHAPAI
jgi:hypothetical protein